MLACWLQLLEERDNELERTEATLEGLRDAANLRETVGHSWRSAACMCCLGGIVTQQAAGGSSWNAPGAAAQALCASSSTLQHALWHTCSK